MLQGICQSIGSKLGVESSSVIALSPALATGALYAGAATASVCLRVGSIATEYFGKEELSDQLEDTREKVMSLANKSIQQHAHIVLGLTAVTTAGVFISSYLTKQPEPGALEKLGKFTSDVWNRKYI